MKMTEIKSTDNVYIIGTILEDRKYGIKVGYSDDILNRISEENGYSILFTVYKENAIELINYIQSTFQTEDLPKFWYNLNKLEIIINVIRNF